MVRKISESQSQMSQVPENGRNTKEQNNPLNIKEICFQEDGIVIIPGVQLANLKEALKHVDMQRDLIIQKLQLQSAEKNEKTISEFLGFFEDAFNNGYMEINKTGIPYSKEYYIERLKNYDGSLQSLMRYYLDRLESKIPFYRFCGVDIDFIFGNIGISRDNFFKLPEYEAMDLIRKNILKVRPHDKRFFGIILQETIDHMQMDGKLK